MDNSRLQYLEELQRQLQEVIVDAEAAAAALAVIESAKTNDVYNSTITGGLANTTLELAQRDLEQVRILKEKAVRGDSISDYNVDLISARVKNVVDTGAQTRSETNSYYEGLRRLPNGADLISLADQKAAVAAAVAAIRSQLLMQSPSERMPEDEGLLNAAQKITRQVELDKSGAVDVSRNKGILNNISAQIRNDYADVLRLIPGIESLPKLLSTVAGRVSKLPEVFSTITGSTIVPAVSLPTPAESVSTSSKTPAPKKTTTKRTKAKDVTAEVTAPETTEVVVRIEGTGVGPTDSAGIIVGAESGVNLDQTQQRRKNRMGFTGVGSRDQDVAAIARSTASAGGVSYSAEAGGIERTSRSIGMLMQGGAGAMLAGIMQDTVRQIQDDIKNNRFVEYLGKQVPKSLLDRASTALRAVNQLSSVRTIEGRFTGSDKGNPLGVVRSPDALSTIDNAFAGSILSKYLEGETFNPTTLQHFTNDFTKSVISEDSAPEVMFTELVARSELDKLKTQQTRLAQEATKNPTALRNREGFFKEMKQTQQKIFALEYILDDTKEKLHAEGVISDDSLAEYQKTRARFVGIDDGTTRFTKEQALAALMGNLAAGFPQDMPSWSIQASEYFKGPQSIFKGFGVGSPARLFSRPTAVKQALDVQSGFEDDTEEIRNEIKKAYETDKAAIAGGARQGISLAEVMAEQFGLVSQRAAKKGKGIGSFVRGLFVAKERMNLDVPTEEIQKEVEALNAKITRAEERGETVDADDYARLDYLIDEGIRRTDLSSPQSVLQRGKKAPTTAEIKDVLVAAEDLQESTSKGIPLLDAVALSREKAGKDVAARLEWLKSTFPTMAPLFNKTTLSKLTELADNRKDLSPDEVYKRLFSIVKSPATKSVTSLINERMTTMGISSDQSKAIWKSYEEKGITADIPKELQESFSALDLFNIDPKAFTALKQTYDVEGTADASINLGRAGKLGKLVKDTLAQIFAKPTVTDMLIPTKPGGKTPMDYTAGGLVSDFRNRSRAIAGTSGPDLFRITAQIQSDVNKFIEPTKKELESIDVQMSSLKTAISAASDADKTELEEQLKALRARKNTLSRAVRYAERLAIEAPEAIAQDFTTTSSFERNMERAVTAEFLSNNLGESLYGEDLPPAIDAAKKALSASRAVFLDEQRTRAVEGLVQLRRQGKTSSLTPEQRAARTKEARRLNLIRKALNQINDSFDFADYVSGSVGDTLSKNLDSESEKSLYAILAKQDALVRKEDTIRAEAADAYNDDDAELSYAPKTTVRTRAAQAFAYFKKRAQSITADLGQDVFNLESYKSLFGVFSGGSAGPSPKSRAKKDYILSDADSIGLLKNLATLGGQDNKGVGLIANALINATGKDTKLFEALTGVLKNISPADLRRLSNVSDFNDPEVKKYLEKTAGVDDPELIKKLIRYMGSSKLKLGDDEVTGGRILSTDTRELPDVNGELRAVLKPGEFGSQFLKAERPLTGEFNDVELAKRIRIGQIYKRLSTLLNPKASDSEVNKLALSLFPDLNDTTKIRSEARKKMTAIEGAFTEKELAAMTGPADSADSYLAEAVQRGFNLSSPTGGSSFAKAVASITSVVTDKKSKKPDFDATRANLLNVVMADAFASYKGGSLGITVKEIANSLVTKLSDFLTKKKKEAEEAIASAGGKKIVSTTSAGTTVAVPKSGEVRVASSYDRSAVEADKDTAYVYKEHAYMLDKMLNTGEYRVGSGSAVIRGLENAFALITRKKYDYDTRESEDFQDTDEDFEAFKSINTTLLTGLKASGKPIVFPENFADNPVTQLPKRFNDWLVGQVSDMFGVSFSKAAKTKVADDAKKVIDTATTPARGEIKVTAKGTYGSRTDRNAAAAPVTMVYALDYESPGERRTKKAVDESGGKYVRKESSMSLDQFASAIVKQLKATNATSLNVAGNAIKTWVKAGMSQKDVNKDLFDVLKIVKDRYPKLETIVTGGQTGADIAGAVAAHALGLNVDLFMPEGLRQQDARDKPVTTNTIESIMRYVRTGAAMLNPSLKEAATKPTATTTAAATAPVAKDTSAAKGTAENPRRMGMSYVIEADQLREDLKAAYPSGVSTADLIKAGQRTTTTRKPFGYKVGDFVEMPEIPGSLFQITDMQKPDFSTPEAIKEWEKKEGWSFANMPANVREQVMNPEAVVITYKPAGTAPAKAVKSTPAKSTSTAKPKTESTEAAVSDATSTTAAPSDAVNVYAGTGENTQLSNFAVRPFTYKGRLYNSVEQAYQSLKSGKFIESVYNDPKFVPFDRKGIMTVSRPLTPTPAGESTEASRAALMEELMMASFEQNPEAAALLTATEKKPITHTQDKGFWGTMFPKILMSVRAKLSRSGTVAPKPSVPAESVVPATAAAPDTSAIPASAIAASLKGMGSAISDVLYDSLLKSLKEKGRLPSQLKNTFIGRAWSRVEGAMSPEDFIAAIRGKTREQINALENPILVAMRTMADEEIELPENLRNPGSYLKGEDHARMLNSHIESERRRKENERNESIARNNKIASMSKNFFDIIDAPTAPIAPVAVPTTTPKPSGKPKASPSVRALAKAQGINLEDIGAGSGKNGFITKEDVLLYASLLADSKKVADDSKRVFRTPSETEASRVARARARASKRPEFAGFKPDEAATEPAITSTTPDSITREEIEARRLARARAKASRRPEFAGFEAESAAPKVKTREEIEADRIARRLAASRSRAEVEAERLARRAEAASKRPEARGFTPADSTLTEVIRAARGRRIRGEHRRRFTAPEVVETTPIVVEEPVTTASATSAVSTRVRRFRKSDPTIVDEATMSAGRDARLARRMESSRERFDSAHRARLLVDPTYYRESLRTESVKLEEKMAADAREDARIRAKVNPLIADVVSFRKRAGDNPDLPPKLMDRYLKFVDSSTEKEQEYYDRILRSARVKVGLPEERSISYEDVKARTPKASADADASTTPVAVVTPTDKTADSGAASGVKPAAAATAKPDAVKALTVGKGPGGAPTPVWIVGQSGALHVTGGGGGRGGDSTPSKYVDASGATVVDNEKQGDYPQVPAVIRSMLTALDAYRNAKHIELSKETDPLKIEALQKDVMSASKNALRDILSRAEIQAATDYAFDDNLSYNENLELASQSLTGKINNTFVETDEGLVNRPTKAQVTAALVLEKAAQASRFQTQSMTQRPPSGYGGIGGAVRDRSGLMYAASMASMQAARNAFDQAAGSVVGGTMFEARKSLLETTRTGLTGLFGPLASKTMVDSSGKSRAISQLFDSALIPTTGPLDRAGTEDVVNRLNEQFTNMAQNTGAPMDEIAANLSDLTNTLVSLSQAAEAARTAVNNQLTAEKNRLQGLKDAGAPLKDIQDAEASVLDLRQQAADLDTYSESVGVTTKATTMALNQQKQMAGVLDTGSSRAIESYEQQMRAALTRPGLLSGFARMRDSAKISRDFARDFVGEKNADLLLGRSGLVAYTDRGKKTDLAYATPKELANLQTKLNERGSAVSMEQLIKLQQSSAQLRQVRNQQPFGDKLFYYAAKIRDAETVTQMLNQYTVGLPRQVANTVQQSAEPALNAARTMVTAQGLARSPEVYTAALGAASTQRDLFGGSLTSNLQKVTSFIPLTNAYGVDINKVTNVARKLAAFDPAQGMEGASIAIKEFLSGNVASLSRRFEINRSALSKIDQSDSNTMLDSLNAVLEGMGVTDRLIDEQANSLAAKYDKMLGRLESAEIAISAFLVDKITWPLEQIAGSNSPLARAANEMSLTTVRDERMRFAGDTKLLDAESGLASLDIFSENYYEQLDAVIASANEEILKEAVRFQEVTGVTASVSPYRRIGNMSSSDRMRLRMTALEYMQGGMSKGQAQLQALRDVGGDYATYEEFAPQRRLVGSVTPMSNKERNQLFGELTDLVKQTALVPMKITGRYDADTFYVRRQGEQEDRRLRIAGVDAPELSFGKDVNGNIRFNPLGKEALEASYNIAADGDVILVSEQGIDDNGRLVGQAIVEKTGKDIGAELINQGLATVAFTEGSKMNKRSIEIYERLNEVAADAGVGPVNREAYKLGLGANYGISEEARYAYFMEKYFGGGNLALGIGSGVGGLITAGKLASLTTAGAASTAAAPFFAAALPLLAGAAVGVGAYAGLSYYFDSTDTSSQKVKDLYKIQERMSKEEVEKRDARIMISRLGRQNGYIPGYYSREGVLETETNLRSTVGRGSEGIALEAANAAVKEFQDRVGMNPNEAELTKFENAFVAATQVSTEAVEGLYNKETERGKAYYDSEVVSPITGERMTYFKYATQLKTYFEMGKQYDAVQQLLENIGEDRLLAPIQGLTLFKDNEKLLETAEKYRFTVDSSRLPSVAATPEYIRYSRMPSTREFTMDSFINATTPDRMSMLQQFQEQLLDAPNFKIQAKEYTNQVLEERMQLRQKRFNTVVEANALNALAGLGYSNLGYAPVNAAGGNNQLGYYNTKTGMLTSSVDEQERALAMLSKQAIGAGTQQDLPAAQELEVAQRNAVDKLNDVAEAFREQAQATLANTIMYNSSFANLASSITMNSSAFRDVMDVMSQGDPLFAQKYFRQMSGVDFMSVMQNGIVNPFSQTGIMGFGDMRSSVYDAGLGFQFTSGRGGAMQFSNAYTQGPRGAIAFAQDAQSNNVFSQIMNPQQYFQSIIAPAINGQTELARRGIQQGNQMRDLQRQQNYTMEDITRNGMRQLEQIHRTYTRNMYQLALNNEITKRMTRANMYQSILAADMPEDKRNEILAFAAQGEQRIRHAEQGDVTNFLKNTDLTGDDINALIAAEEAYQATPFTDPDAKEAAQLTRMNAAEVVKQRLQSLIDAETDPVKRSEYMRQMALLGKDPARAAALEPILVSEVQRRVGDATLGQSVSYQQQDAAYEASGRPLRRRVLQKALDDAYKADKKDPVAYALGIEQAQKALDDFDYQTTIATRNLGIAERQLNAATAAAPLFSDAFTTAFDTIGNNSSTTLSGLLNDFDDFGRGIRTEIENAAINFERQKLALVTSFGDAMVEIAAQVPPALATATKAFAEFAAADAQASALMYAGDTKGALDVYMQASSKYAKAMFPDDLEKQKQFESLMYQSRPQPISSSNLTGGLSDFAVMTADGPALRVSISEKKVAAPPPPPPTGTGPGGYTGGKPTGTGPFTYNTDEYTAPVKGVKN